MTDNTDSVVTGTLNTKVLAVAERVVREFQLAAEKVAAHHNEPARYPMPAGSTAMEHLMASRFKALPEGTRKKAADRVVADLKNAPGRAKKLDNLAKVDLRSTSTVEAQVKKLPFPAKLRFPAGELRKAPVVVAAAEASGARRGRGSAAAAGTAAAQGEVHRRDQRAVQGRDRARRHRRRRERRRREDLHLQGAQLPQRWCPDVHTAAAPGPVQPHRGAGQVPQDLLRGPRAGRAGPGRLLRLREQAVRQGAGRGRRGSGRCHLGGACPCPPRSTS